MRRTFSYILAVFALSFFISCGPGWMGADYDRENSVAVFSADTGKKIEKKQTEIQTVYLAQTKMSPAEYGKTPLIEKSCEVGTISFYAEGYPLSVSHTKDAVFVESSLKDRHIFEAYSKMISKYWDSKPKAIEDQGSRLIQKQEVSKRVTYRRVIEAFYEFYDDQFINVEATFVCRNLPKWVVRAFPGKWKPVIERAPTIRKGDEQKELKKEDRKVQQRKKNRKKQDQKKQEKK